MCYIVLMHWSHFETGVLLKKPAHGASVYSNILLRPEFQLLIFGYTKMPRSGLYNSMLITDVL